MFSTTFDQEKPLESFLYSCQYSSPALAAPASIWWKKTCTVYLQRGQKITTPRNSWKGLFLADYLDIFLFLASLGNYVLSMCYTIFSICSALSDQRRNGGRDWLLWHSRRANWCWRGRHQEGIQVRFLFSRSPCFISLTFFQEACHEVSPWQESRDWWSI